MSEFRPLFVPRPDLSTDEKRYLEHVLRHKDGVLARRLQWIGDLASLVRRRDRFREQPEMVAMFWIRLYGAVTEHLETQQKEIKGLSDEFVSVDGRTYLCCQALIPRRSQQRQEPVNNVPQLLGCPV